MNQYRELPRILFVHAHPDDEAIWTGLFIATAIRHGMHVEICTCTLGEEGEVIPPELARFVTDTQHPEGTGLLGGFRYAELQRARAALGLSAQPVILGGVGAWRDSGMAGTPTIEQRRAFANETAHEAKENFDQQVHQLSELIREIQPDLVVTYGPDGGYGHPDHIRAHRITHDAVAQTVAEGQAYVKQILWAVTDLGAVERGFESLQPDAVPAEWTRDDLAGVPTDDVDFHVVGSPADCAVKLAAMQAHATQILVAPSKQVFALSNLVTQPVLPSEGYQVGWTAPGVPENWAVEALGDFAEHGSSVVPLVPTADRTELHNDQPVRDGQGELAQHADETVEGGMQ